MIPRRIWQTYKTHALPPQAAECVATWRAHNPDWAYTLVDDAEADAFVREHFDARCYAVYRALPLAVMRADLWRYCVLARLGGVYADVDTTCEAPIDTWTGWADGAEAIIGKENDTHFCQWAIAAAPEHPMLTEVIQRIVDRAWSQGIDTANEHFVHHHTGPTIWTEAIAYICGMPAAPARAIHERYAGTLAPGRTRLAPYAFFQGDKVKHLYGSKYFTADYPKWVDQRAALPKRLIHPGGRS